MTSIPPILDFEASSLSDCSYPITAGLVINGVVRYWIIKPEPTWIDWSLASQSIHGIKRSDLISQGTDATSVYEEMKSLLSGVQTIYSDNPYWEARWLRCLGQFDCNVSDIRNLLPVNLHSEWQECLAHQFMEHALTRHRADHDAFALYLAVSSLRKHSATP